MKNIYEVLRQKEQEIQQLQKEIEALRVAARLLADDDESTARPAPSTPAVRTTASVSTPPTPSQVMRQFP